MAEPVGTALGALGVVGLLGVCLDCFDFVQDGISLGRDFVYLESQLSALRIRLYAWAVACGFIYAPGDRVAGYDERLNSPEWRQHVQKQLNCISLLFLDAAKILSRFDLAERYEQPEEYPFKGMPREKFIEEGLQDFLARIRKTKKRAGILGQFNWALVYRKRFTELVQKLKDCIEALELFHNNPDLFEKRRRVIVEQIEMISDIEALEGMITTEPPMLPMVGNGTFLDTEPKGGTGMDSCPASVSGESDVVSDAASQRILRLRESSLDGRTLAGTSTHPSGTYMTARSHFSAPMDTVLETDAKNEDEGGADSTKAITAIVRGIFTTPAAYKAIQKALIDDTLNRNQRVGASHPLLAIDEAIAGMRGRCKLPCRINMAGFPLNHPISLPDLILAAVSQIRILTDVESWGPLEPLFCSLLESSRWVDTGRYALQNQLSAMQRQLRLGHYALSFALGLNPDLIEGPWGLFQTQNRLLLFRARSRDLAQALFHDCLCILAGKQDRMPAEWHIPRRAKDLAEQQGGFLQNVQTPQLEMLLGAVLEIYATKCLLQILGEAARARLENTPTGTAVPQHVRVVEENFRRVQPSPISEWEQADDSLWGQSLEPLKKQDKMHLNETIRLFSPGGGHEMLHHLGGRSRLVREFKSFRDAPTASHITFRFVRFNAGESVWIRASFEGPPRSPYRGGIFHLLLTLPSAYPLKPPTVRFLTRIYHPNVNPQGDLCMDALQPSNWVPGLTLEFLLISIVGLLSDPDVDDPFVPEIASTYIRDKAEFDRSAEVYTAKYAGSAQKYPIYGVG